MPYHATYCDALQGSRHLKLQSNEKSESHSRTSQSQISAREFNFSLNIRFRFRPHPTASQNSQHPRLLGPSTNPPLLGDPALHSARVVRMHRQSAGAGARRQFLKAPALDLLPEVLQPARERRAGCTAAARRGDAHVSSQKQTGLLEVGVRGGAGEGGGVPFCGVEEARASGWGGGGGAGCKLLDPGGAVGGGEGEGEGGDVCSLG
jgi:hypothetical protein